jgi:hypothetical protein
VLLFIDRHIPGSDSLDAPRLDALGDGSGQRFKRFPRATAVISSSQMRRTRSPVCTGAADVLSIGADQFMGLNPVPVWSAKLSSDLPR